MEYKFKLNPDKSINSMLFIINSLGGETDFHTLFKILYFADRKHLARYGNPISGDVYIAMKNGTVPSNIYDMLKYLKGESSSFCEIKNPDELDRYFSVKDYSVSSLLEPDTDMLAETDIECLTESLSENKDLNYFKLEAKSHDDAWDKADMNGVISFFDIAKVGGASDEMVKYIRINIENQNLSFKWIE